MAPAYSYPISKRVEDLVMMSYRHVTNPSGSDSPTGLTPCIEVTRSEYWKEVNQVMHYFNPRKGYCSLSERLSHYTPPSDKCCNERKPVRLLATKGSHALKELHRQLPEVPITEH